MNNCSKTKREAHLHLDFSWHIIYIHTLHLLLLSLVVIISTEAELESSYDEITFIHSARTVISRSIRWLQQQNGFPHTAKRLHYQYFKNSVSSNGNHPNPWSPNFFLEHLHGRPFYTEDTIDHTQKSRPHENFVDFIIFSVILMHTIH